MSWLATAFWACLVLIELVVVCRKRPVFVEDTFPVGEVVAVKFV